MIFSRVLSLISFFTLFASFSLVASNPVTLPGAGVAIKRQSTDVDSALDSLQGQLNTILPQLDAISDDDNASEDDITTTVNQLTAAIDSTSASLGGASLADLSKRQTNQATAQRVATIVSDVATSSNKLKSKHGHKFPVIAVLLVTLDVALHKLLITVELLVAGVLKLVAGLLIDVAILLKGLAFGLTLAALGI
ncbi:hypothetical protein VKT23_008656 [Stygiomarasmius scandens]|uniref:Uncharacterized protein n=1 Tax=Marasmiellus scandens TaxID=2682957 RepID=A0ABR1JH21_9AGAR